MPKKRAGTRTLLGMLGFGDAAPFVLSARERQAGILGYRREVRTHE
jgi:hypothetical protein